MAYYFWIKAAHLIAVMMFIGGMVLNGFLFRHLEPGAPQSERLAAAARRWNGPFIGTALLAVWVLGLTLAYLGSWYWDIWLMGKVALVFVLSGIHGAQSAAFRRLQQSPGEPISPMLRNSIYITIGFVFLIVILVTIKPV